MLQIVKKLVSPLLRSYGKRRGLNLFYKDYKKFKKLDVNKRLPALKKDIFPCLDDKTTGTYFDSHYIYHPAWAARIVKEIDPAKHVDISSTLHFCTILSAFIATEFYDYRPASLDLDNLVSKKMDLTDLHFPTNSIESLSCMHTLEHIGLGRYGDVIDPDSDLKAIKELMRVCAINGNLIIVVPVGIEKIMFNAHRIYNASVLANYFNGFTLKEFSLITDDGRFTRNASFETAASQNYGCGCFWFIKNTN
jgi:hypothetical protein